MRRIPELAIYAVYPFLVFSLLLAMGSCFGLAFLSVFSIQNRTSVPIVVTPVGTIGPEGTRRQLPVMLPFLPLPAFKSGGYRLAPGDSINIWYDMDDINFSEIVVEHAGQKLQLVTDPTPTTNQYHGPSQSSYVIDDLSRLSEATPAVQAAAGESRPRLTGAVRGYGLLVGPWLVYGLLFWLARRWPRVVRRPS